MGDEPARKRTRPVVPYKGKVDASRPADDGAGAPRRPLVLLVVFVVLAVMGWFLIQNLWASSKLQDCMMSGRKNCAPIDTSGK